MHQFSTIDGACEFVRISKIRARKIFDGGGSIYVIANKMRPGGPFHMGMDIDIHRHSGEHGNEFQRHINGFIYYNCTHETGYYPSFYLRSNRKGNA